jgi:hypothetical protein
MGRRGIDGAATLLRLALVYGGTNLGLRGTAAWTKAAWVADLSDVAILYRLQGAEGWLAALARALLSQEIRQGGRRADRALAPWSWREASERAPDECLVVGERPQQSGQRGWLRVMRRCRRSVHRPAIRARHVGEVSLIDHTLPSTVDAGAPRPRWRRGEPAPGWR